MNLIFDIGNTFNKLAVYDRSKKVFAVRTRELSCEKLHEKISPFRITKGIISSVKELPDFIFDLISVNIPFVHILSHNSKLPFKNEYETPDTLGPDRIAAVAGACFHFPGREVLVIDAGSAITYDFLSGKAYKGGNISPGLAMRMRALHRFTGRLPLVPVTGQYSVPARNTEEALRAGVITGVVYEINEYIRTFKKEHKKSTVIITGGDGGFLKDKTGYRVKYLPDLVMDGLNYILEHNAK